MSLKFKYIITITTIIIGFFGWNYTFAQTTGLECLKDREKANIFVELLLRLLAWFWIIPATLAGKLMSNSILYGEFINIDKILYVLWNMSRTFANFFAAGMILWEVIQGIIGKNDDTAIMKKVLRVGVGIIIANMSRFLIGAVVDISTILTSTVSALPGTYFNADTASRNMILTQDGKNKLQKRITLDLTTKFCDGGKVTESSEIIGGIDKNENETLDMFMPKNESIAGPLLYIGSSVLKIQDFIVTNNTNSSGVDYFMIIVIRLFMTIIFFIALIILLVINVIRIVSVWFFIAFSPLIILYSIVQETMTLPDILKDFSITNILKLIFAPVVITGLLSIALIVIVLMQQVLQSNNSYIDFTDGVYIKTLPDKNSRIGVNGIFQTDIQGELLSVKENVANTFSDLIMGGMTLAILRGIILAIQSYNKDGISGKIVGGITDISKSLLGSLPIVPLPGIGNVGIGTLKNKIGSLPNTISKSINNKGDEKIRDIENALSGLSNQYLGTDLAFNIPSDHKKSIEKMNKLFNSNNSGTKLQDINKLFEIGKYHNIDKKGVYYGKENSLSNTEFSNSIINMFQYIHRQHNDDIRLFSNGSFKGKIDWKEGDEKDFYKFLTRNLADNNRSKDLKEFLKYIYIEMGGDGSVIDNSYGTKIGEVFWTKTFKKFLGST